MKAIIRKWLGIDLAACKRASEIELLRDVIHTVIAHSGPFKDDTASRVILAMQTMVDLQLCRSSIANILLVFFKFEEYVHQSELVDELTRRAERAEIKLKSANDELDAGWSALRDAQAPSTDYICNSIRQLAEDRDAELKQCENWKINSQMLKDSYDNQNALVEELVAELLPLRTFLSEIVNDAFGDMRLAAKAAKLLNK